MAITKATFIAPADLKTFHFKGISSKGALIDREYDLTKDLNHGKLTLPDGTLLTVKKVDPHNVDSKLYVTLKGKNVETAPVDTGIGVDLHRYKTEEGEVHQNPSPDDNTPVAAYSFTNPLVFHNFTREPSSLEKSREVLIYSLEFVELTAHEINEETFYRLLAQLHQNRKSMRMKPHFETLWKAFAPLPSGDKGKAKSDPDPESIKKALREIFKLSNVPQPPQLDPSKPPLSRGSAGSADDLSIGSSKPSKTEKKKRHHSLP